MAIADPTFGGAFTKPEFIDRSIHYAAIGIELAGIAIIIIAALISTITYLLRLARRQREGSFAHYRAQLGMGILLGLEFLVAADIIGTVAVAPSWQNVGTLAVIVLIRTFLSMTLEIEINGKLPWKTKSGSSLG